MQDKFIIRHHQQIGSTNDEARRLAEEGAPHGTVIHADEQTAGRGRLAHTWWSPPGNLYVSIIVRTENPLLRPPELSFVAALAVADTVETMLPKQIRAVLKWPNDVLINGAKIAGILLEQMTDATIIGIGVNVLHAPDISSYKTTTIAASGGIASVDGVRDVLLDRLGRNLSLWRDQGFAAVKAAWLGRSYPVGSSIQATIGGLPIAGIFAGLDPDGALLLETQEGLQRIVAGEVFPA